MRDGQEARYAGDVCSAYVVADYASAGESKGSSSSLLKMRKWAGMKTEGCSSFPGSELVERIRLVTGGNTDCLQPTHHPYSGQLTSVTTNTHATATSNSAFRLNTRLSTSLSFRFVSAFPASSRLASTGAKTAV